MLVTSKLLHLQGIEAWYSELDRLNSSAAGGGFGQASFSELKAHFIVATDETCLLASAAGGAKVLGDKQKKHEKILHDSRESITLVRCASLAGATGPTNFLLGGAKVKSWYNKPWLQRNGAAPGSSITMTPSAFMTDKAWEEMVLDRARGIRAMPVICNNPGMWVLEILDGFGSHCNCPKALQIYYDHKILQAKEEADTSHVCQLYDQQPAKKDKKELRNEELRPA